MTLTSFNRKRRNKYQRTHITGYYFTQQFYKSSERKCCLHADKSPTVEPIILFNEESLAKCRQVLQKRKGGNLKYAGTVLLSIGDHQSNYHMSCYRKFIALPKKHRRKRKSNHKVGVNVKKKS